MASIDIFDQLRTRLDQLAFFPKTEEKIEMKILRRLFTEEDARLFLQLTPMLQTPEEIAKKLAASGMDHELPLLANQLESMAKKGLLFRHRKGDQVKYAIVPYIIGIFEHQLNHMDKTFAEENLAYFKSGFEKSFSGMNTPLLRTIPINKTILPELPIAPYDDVFKIVENQKIIAISPCICRRWARLTGNTCEKPEEVCFSFGAHADYYVENGMGRYISKDDAIAILKKNDEIGLVMQPFNAVKPGGMCSCCGDCCGVLKSIKMNPAPAQLVKSNYYVSVNESDCSGCETCVGRCQMEAIEIVDAIAKINYDRCIGCGLCVSTCPTEAMSLVQKSQDHQYLPPSSGTETYLRIAKERGLI
ncbi:MAG: 4Fe-4S binding protein [Desulfobacterales bacterium]|nr:4Fe-4S binding protein [Desulfobacterales bacterium]